VCLQDAVYGAVWCGAVAQLGERLVRNEEVSGSIPLSSTKESTTCGIGIESHRHFCVICLCHSPFVVRCELPSLPLPPDGQ
jgi:hypothetical protein